MKKLLILLLFVFFSNNSSVYADLNFTNDSCKKIEKEFANYAKKEGIIQVVKSSLNKPGELNGCKIFIKSNSNSPINISGYIYLEDSDGVTEKDTVIELDIQPGTTFVLNIHSYRFSNINNFKKATFDLEYRGKNINTINFNSPTDKNTPSINENADDSMVKYIVFIVIVAIDISRIISAEPEKQQSKEEKENLSPAEQQEEKIPLKQETEETYIDVSPTDEDIDENTDEYYSDKMLKAFVGDNVAWYKNTFSFYTFGFTWRWSWWAFFGGEFYLLYRKCYMWSFVCIFARYFVYTTTSNYLSIIFWIALGVASPYLVYQRYINLKKNIELGESDNKEGVKIMQKYGGTNDDIVLTILVVVFIVMILVFYRLGNGYRIGF
jgi:hypothetical protein